MERDSRINASLTPTTRSGTVTIAVSSPPGVDRVGISIVHGGGEGKIETIAATELLAPRSSTSHCFRPAC